MNTYQNYRFSLPEFADGYFKLFSSNKVNPDLVNHILRSVTPNITDAFQFMHIWKLVYIRLKNSIRTHITGDLRQPFASYSKSHRHMKAGFKCKQYVHRRKVNSQEKKSKTAFVAIEIYLQIGRYPKIQCVGSLHRLSTFKRTAIKSSMVSQHLQHQCAAVQYSLLMG